MPSAVMLTCCSARNAYYVPMTVRIVCHKHNQQALQRGWQSWCNAGLTDRILCMLHSG